MWGSVGSWGSVGLRGSVTFRAATVVVMALVAPMLSSCGGEGGTQPTGTQVTGTQPTSSALGTVRGTSTVVDPAPALVATGVRTVRGTATAAILPSALDGLREYLKRVERADARLVAVASLVNKDTSASGIRLRRATRAAIVAITLDDVAKALPAGTGDDLLRRSLLVYSELVSRRAAYQGLLSVSPGADGTTVVARGTEGMTMVLACLANGARAGARFTGDLAALWAAAASARPFTVAAPSSRASGEILVRTGYIDGWNRCCAGCGGYVTDTLAPLVWAAKDFPSGEHIDGTVDGVGFEATYGAGTGWKIVIHAG
ncbi:MAG: hypothetical protein QG622_3588 [Actinomycetota bacterium]|nr:hypothetical protein [Actinomycetota bacterium]